MYIYRIGFVAFPVLAIVLTGCAKKELSCADDETIGIIKSMVVEQSVSLSPQPDYFFKTVKNPNGLVDPYFPPSSSIGLENIRLKSISKDIGKVECEADMVISLPETYASTIADSNKAGYLQAAKSGGYQLRMPVEYTSQPTEDKKTYVQVGGIKVVRDIFDMVMIYDKTMQNFIAENKAMMVGLAGWRSCGSSGCTFHDNASDKDFDIKNLGAIDLIMEICPEGGVGVCKISALVKGDKIYYASDVVFQ